MRSKRHPPLYDPAHKGRTLERTFDTPHTGLVLGIARHSLGSVKAQTRWGWSIDPQSRKPR